MLTLLLLNNASVDSPSTFRTAELVLVLVVLIMDDESKGAATDNSFIEQLQEPEEE
jgi:hypothetical protein